MKKRPRPPDLRVHVLLIPVVVGCVILIGAAVEGNPYPTMVAIGIGAGLVELLRPRRCPACGRHTLPKTRPWGGLRCKACGQRFQRIAWGRAIELELERPLSPGGERLTWMRREAVEPITPSPDAPKTGVSRLLSRLQAVRRQLRPSRGLPRRVLRFAKKPPAVEIELPAPWEVVGTQHPADVPTPEPPTPRGAIVQAVLAVVISTAFVAIADGLERLRVWDEAYFIVAVCAIAACGVTAFVIGMRLRLSVEAALALFAANLVLDALHLAAITRLPNVYALATMIIVFPATPFLLGRFFRRWRTIDEPAGEFTTGHLLRNKQARVAARTGQPVTGVPSMTHTVP